MKIAIIGSRGINDIDLSLYADKGITEIISGGAIGVDTIAKTYAIYNNIKYTEFIPDYSKYGRAAPILRNKQIVDYSDFILIFWDGSSKGTKSVIEYCKKNEKRASNCLYVSFENVKKAQARVVLTLQRSIIYSEKQ